MGCTGCPGNGCMLLWGQVMSQVGAARHTERRRQARTPLPHSRTPLPLPHPSPALHSLPATGLRARHRRGIPLTVHAAPILPVTSVSPDDGTESLCRDSPHSLTHSVELPHTEGCGVGLGLGLPWQAKRSRGKAPLKVTRRAARPQVRSCRQPHPHPHRQPHMT